MDKKSLANENYYDTSIPGAGVGSIPSNIDFAPFKSPNTGQDPSNFGVFHVSSQSDANAFYNRIEDVQDDALDFNIPIEDAIDIIYSRDIIPHPDEFLIGMKYEMQKMLIPDMDLARRRVLKNILKTPDYYSGLKMLNIDDTFMESLNLQKVNNLLEIIVLIKKKLLS